MEITDNRIKTVQSIKTVTTVLLLLVGLTSIFPLTAIATVDLVPNVPDNFRLEGSSTVIIHIGVYFRDPEGRNLRYQWTTPSATVVTVKHNTGAYLEVTPKGAGTVTITVTATDKDSNTNNKVITVTVNGGPRKNGSIARVTLPAGGSAATVDVSSYFSDPNSDTLTYTALSLDSSKVTASVVPNTANVTITPVAKGTATVRVTASDGLLTVNQTIPVTVTNRAPGAEGTIAPVTVHIGGSNALVGVSSNFSDADGDPLTYTAKSSDDTKATASAAGAIVIITAVAKGTTTVTVTATDDDGATATQDIDVTVPNRAPGAEGTIAPVTVDVGGSAATVDVASKFSDPDSDTLTYTVESSDTTKATVGVAGATVTITPVAAGTITVTVTATDDEDATAQQTIAVKVNGAPEKVGTLALLGGDVGGNPVMVDLSSHFSDPNSDTLTYTAESSDVTKATVSVLGAILIITPKAAGIPAVTVTASDGRLTGERTIAVKVNGAPTAVGTISGRIVNVGNSAIVSMSGKFSDPNNDTLTYTAKSSDTTKVTVRVSGTDVVITAGRAGTATVTVTASDGSLTGEQTIAVKANGAPTKVGTIAPVTVDVGGSAATVDVAGKFSDPNNDTLTYTAVSASEDTTKATVGMAGTVVTITPVAAGIATVTVTATDGQLTAQQTIAVKVNGAPTAVGTIAPVTVNVGGDAATVDVAGKFSDPNSDALTYTAKSSATSKAAATVSGANVTITPVAAGTATVTVTATDGRLTVQQTIAVTVNGAPTGVGTIAPVTLDVGGSAATVDVAGKFSDLNNTTLTYTAESSDTTKATVGMTGTVVTITPVAAGTVTVTVTASDGTLTAQQTIAVKVNGAPTKVGTIAPVTVDVNGNAAIVGVASKFSDPNGDTLTYTAVSSATTKATVSVLGATVLVTPKAAGTATVTVTATDGRLTVQQTIAVKVNGAPAKVGTIAPVTVDVNGSAATVDVAGKFSDPNSDALTYTAESSDTAKATVGVAGTVVTITPVAAGTVTVTVTASDGRLTATQTIVVKVNGAPAKVGTINTVTVHVNGNAAVMDVSSYFSDPNGDTLTYTAESSDTTKATVSVSGPNVTITPKTEGATTVTVTASDGRLTVQRPILVSVTAALNRAPTAVGTIAPVTVYLGGSATIIDVSNKFNDPDGNILAYTAESSDETKATVSVLGANVTITPVTLGLVTVTVTASDGSLSARQTIIVSVTPVPNRAPVAVGTIDPVTLTDGGDAATVDVSSKFRDPDNHSLTYTAVSSDGSDVKVSVLGTVVTITPAAQGAATVTVTATDGSLTATQTIAVTVNPNRAPVAEGTIDPVTVTAGASAITVDVSDKFKDPDNNPLTYTALSLDRSKATVSVSGPNVTITPREEGTATVRVTATDGKGLTATQIITVTVTAVPNRAPTAVGNDFPGYTDRR